MTDRKQLSQKAQALSERIHAALDQMRVKSHLMGLEMKDASKEVEKTFTELQGKLDRFIEESKTEAGQVQLQSHLALMESQERLEAIKEDAREIFLSTKGKASQKWDKARLKTHLAKMDAKDYFAEKKEAWQKQWQDSVDKGQELTEKQIDRMSSIIDAIRH